MEFNPFMPAGPKITWLLWFSEYIWRGNVDKKLTNNSTSNISAINDCQKGYCGKYHRSRRRPSRRSPGIQAWMVDPSIPKGTQKRPDYLCYYFYQKPFWESVWKRLYPNQTYNSPSNIFQNTFLKLKHFFYCFYQYHFHKYHSMQAPHRSSGHIDILPNYSGHFVCYRHR